MTSTRIPLVSGGGSGGGTSTPLTLSPEAIAQGFSLNGQELVVPDRYAPVLSRISLEDFESGLNGKTHSILEGGVADLSSNTNDATLVFGTLPIGADGAMQFSSNTDRITLDTDGSNSEVFIYAYVRVSSATTSLSVFGNDNTFIPLASATTAGADISRLDGVSNAPFVINGVSSFANRIAVHTALAVDEYVIIEVPNIPNGESISIGDHIQNNAFSFFGDLLRLVVLNEEPTTNEKLIVDAYLENGFIEAFEDSSSTISAQQNQIANFGSIEVPLGANIGEYLESSPETSLLFNTDGTETVGDLVAALGAIGGAAVYWEIGSTTSVNLLLAERIPSGSYSVARGGDDFLTLVQKSVNSFITNNNSGLHRVGVFDQLVNIGTADTVVSTGFDLSQPELYLEFEFSDNGGSTRSWQTGRLRVDRIIDRFNAGDTVDGYVHVFDNDFVIINITDVATGELALRYSGRDIGLTRLELYQVAQGVSSRVGMTEWGASGRTPDEGYLPMTGVVANGAIDYPVAAARRPFDVAANGLDFDFTKYEGASVRNLGGNAAVEGEFQGFATNVDGISVIDPTVSGRQTNRRTGGSNAAFPNTTNVTRSLQGGAIETRMDNVAEQKYLIVDTYHEMPGSNSGVPSVAEPFLLTNFIPQKYQDSVDNTVYKVDVYSDGTKQRFNSRLADDTGDFTRFAELPSTFTRIFTLLPSLPLGAGAVAIFFSKDNDTFGLNGANQSGDTLNVEFFIENVPYAEIPNITYPAGLTNPALESRSNFDGTHNHIISFQLAPNESFATIGSDLLVPSGDNVFAGGTSSNPPAIHYEVV